MKVSGPQASRPPAPSMTACVFCVLWDEWRVCYNCEPWLLDDDDDDAAVDDFDENGCRKTERPPGGPTWADLIEERKKLIPCEIDDPAPKKAKTTANTTTTPSTTTTTTTTSAKPTKATAVKSMPKPKPKVVENMTTATANDVGSGSPGQWSVDRGA